MKAKNSKQVFTALFLALFAFSSVAQEADEYGAYNEVSSIEPQKEKEKSANNSSLFTRITALAVGAAAIPKIIVALKRRAARARPPRPLRTPPTTRELLTQVKPGRPTDRLCQMAPGLLKMVGRCLTPLEQTRLATTAHGVFRELEHQYFLSADGIIRAQPALESPARVSHRQTTLPSAAGQFVEPIQVFNGFALAQNLGTNGEPRTISIVDLRTGTLVWSQTLGARQASAQALSFRWAAFLVYENGRRDSVQTANLFVVNLDEFEVTQTPVGAFNTDPTLQIVDDELTVTRRIGLDAHINEVHRYDLRNPSAAPAFQRHIEQPGFISEGWGLRVTHAVPGDYNGMRDVTDFNQISHPTYRIGPANGRAYFHLSRNAIVLEERVENESHPRLVAYDFSRPGGRRYILLDPFCEPLVAGNQLIVRGADHSLWFFGLNDVSRRAQILKFGKRRSFGMVRQGRQMVWDTSDGLYLIDLDNFRAPPRRIDERRGSFGVKSMRFMANILVTHDDTNTLRFFDLSRQGTLVHSLPSTDGMILPYGGSNVAVIYDYRNSLIHVLNLNDLPAGPITVAIPGLDEPHQIGGYLFLNASSYLRISDIFTKPAEAGAGH